MIEPNFKLPTGQNITLLYFGGLQSSTGYLHYKRTTTPIKPETLEASRIIYDVQLELKIIPTVYAELKSIGQSFDAIAMAPSSQSDAYPLFEYIQKRHDIPNISDRFRKKPGFRSMINSGNIDAARKAIDYQGCPSAENIKSLLLIDESIGTGQTAAVMIEKLLDAGMPKDSEITLAVLLRI